MKTMGKKTYTVATCDHPSCTEEDGGIERVTVTIGEKTVRADLCALHRKPILELFEILPTTGRRARQRGIKVVNPEDIPRLK